MLSPSSKNNDGTGSLSAATSIVGRVAMASAADGRTANTLVEAELTGRHSTLDMVTAGPDGPEAV